MNKRILLISSLFFLVCSTGIAQDWIYDFDFAKIQAKERDQNILLLFTGSDWCSPCMKLEKFIFSTEEFKDFANPHFVLLKADFPKRKKNKLRKEQEDKNFTLAKQYNRRMSFPLVLVLDKEGKILGKTGYRKTSVKKYITKLTSFER